MRVMVFGTFDDLHPGHEYVFTQALERGDVWAVVARDSNVMKIKGRAPLQSENDRIRKIQQMFPDVRTVLGDEADFLAPVRAVEPDLILLGYDQKLPPGVREEDLGAAVERLQPFHPEIHKSSLRRNVRGDS